MGVHGPHNMRGDAEMKDVLYFFFGNGLNPEQLKDYFKIVYHWTPDYDMEFNKKLKYISKIENKSKWNYWDIIQQKYM